MSNNIENSIKNIFKKIDLINYNKNIILPFTFKQRIHRLDTSLFNLDNINELIRDNNTNEIMKNIKRITYSKLEYNDKETYFKY